MPPSATAPGLNPPTTQRGPTPASVRSYARSSSSRTPFCAAGSVMARSSAKFRRSPCTMNWRAGKVTLRPGPSRRRQIAKPTSLSPSSSPPMKWISASASLSAGFPCSLRRILTSIFMASLREVARPRSAGPGHSLRCYAFASARSVAGEPIRFHSQCCSVFTPTSTGSVGAQR